MNDMLEPSPVNFQKVSRIFFLIGLILVILETIEFFTGWLNVPSGTLYVGGAMLLVSLYLSRAVSRR